MSFDQAFGGAAFGGQSEGGGGSASLTATIEQHITGITYALHGVIEQRIYTDTGALAATIEQRIVYPSTIYTATIEQRVRSATQALSAGIEQQIYGTPTGIWSPLVRLDGVDISASLTGSLSIKSSEDAAAIASLTLEPADGAVDLLSYIAKPITIDYADDDWNVRRFTGIVSSPQYSPQAGTIELECTTDLQGALESRLREHIDELMPHAQWSRDVFDDNADGWQYAQDLASTAGGSLWSDKHRSVQFTAWAAKATPDVSLTASDIIGGEVKVKHASKRGMVKRNLIEIDYRFFNLRTRQHHFSFQMTVPFCQFMVRGFRLPSRDMVRSAAVSTGWQLDSISFTGLPPSQYFNCPGSVGSYRVGWIYNPIIDKKLCTGAHFDVSKRWAQRVTENYLIDVRCDDDLDVANQYAVRESYGIRSEFDTAEWEREVNNVGLSSGEKNPLPSGGGLHPGGSGDYSEEADTDRRTEMEQAQRTILARAASEIIDSHRQTDVSFTILMRPRIDLSQTIQVTTPEVTAKGKARQIEERLNIASGEATQRVTLAISRKAGVGLSGHSDPLDPVTRPAATQEQPYDRSIRLGWRIGGIVDNGTGSLGQADENDDDFNGYSTNWQDANPNDNSLIFYSNRMTVICPEIEKAAVDATVVAAEQVVKIVVPDDTLTLTK